MSEYAFDIDKWLGKALIGGMLVAYLVIAGLAAMQSVGPNLMEGCRVFVPLLSPFVVFAALVIWEPLMMSRVIPALVGMQAVIDAIWVLSGPHAGWPVTHVPMWIAVFLSIAIPVRSEFMEYYRRSIRLF